MFVSKSSTQSRTYGSRIFRALAEDSKRGVWALADQAIVSFGNFGLNIFLARYFAVHRQLGEYGAYWVLMELMFFLNSVQNALVIYPLMIRGVALNPTELGKLTSRSLTLTLFVSPLLTLCMILAATMASLPVSTGIWAGIAVLCWQFQETTRRALMSHLRFRAACIGDAISYVGQVGMILLLSFQNRLTLQRTFEVIAATSLLACLFQSLQLGTRVTRRTEVLSLAREYWDIGRWMLYGNLTGLFSGVFFTWNFAYWAGFDLLGVYQALANLIRPAHPLAFAVATLITPHAAKTFVTVGFIQAQAVAARFALFGGALLLPYLGILFIFPKFGLAIFYGRGSAYMQYASMVQVAAIAVAFVYLGIVTGAFLSGVSRTRQSFIGQLCSAGSYAIFVLPLTAIFGLQGAIWGWMGASAIQAAINLYFCAARISPEMKRDDPELTSDSAGEFATG